MPNYLFTSEDNSDFTFEKIKRTKPKEGQRDPKRDKKRQKDFSQQRERKRTFE